MIGRVWNAYRQEIYKAVRYRWTYAGPLLITAISLLMPLARPFTRDGVGDYLFIAELTSFAINFPCLLFIVSYAAALVSSDMGTGVIRMSLVRPIRRGEYLFAKLLLAWSYGLMLLGIPGFVGWLLVLLFGDLTGVSFGGELLFTNTEMAMVYAKGFALSILPMSACAAYGLFLSCTTRNPGAAVSIAVTLWLATDLTKYPLRVASFLFTSYLEVPWQTLGNQAQGFAGEGWPGVWSCAAVSLIWTAIFLWAGIVIMSRRNFRI